MPHVRHLTGKKGAGVSHQLTSAQCIELIQNHGFAVRKKYGQNFLIDENVLRGITEFSGAEGDSCVLEIGPGMGALTGYLVERAGKVIAVEIDKMLIPILEGTLSHYDNLVLINDDILKTDIADLISRENAGRPIKVVANLPYYITTPIILDLLENELNIASITVMVQKEVAERMLEGPGSKAYGALSLAVQYYSKPHMAMNVPRHCFYPQPDVDSAVIRMDVYRPDMRPVKAEDTKEMFRVIRAAFGQRRKTLVNALGNAPDLRYSKAQIVKALEVMGKSETVRGEVLDLEEFAGLTGLLIHQDTSA